MDYKNYDVYAKCPFYIKVKEKGIMCEGLIPKTVTEHSFENEVEKWRRFSGSCCCDYQKCVHYKCLERFYEEKERDNG